MSICPNDGFMGPAMDSEMVSNIWNCLKDDAVLADVRRSHPTTRLISQTTVLIIIVEIYSL